MTVTTQITKEKFLTNGLATVWPLPFPVREAEHLRIILTTLAAGPGGPDGMGGRDEVVTSGYSVTGLGGNNVSVTYPVSGNPLPPGYRLTIYRLVPYVQDLDLENGQAFDAEVLEAQYDIQEMQIQQLAEEVSRAVKVAISSDEEPKTAEDIYSEVNKIADRAEDAVTRAADAVERAEDARDRAEIAAESAETNAGRIMNLSIAVDDAPYGHMASGSYNPATGMLTLRVPEGKQGETGIQGPAGVQGIQGPQGVQGPRGPEGPQGNSGVIVEMSGIYGFAIQGDDLVMVYDDGTTPPVMRIDDNGDLIMEGL